MFKQKTHRTDSVHPRYNDQSYDSVLINIYCLSGINEDIFGFPFMPIERN